MRKGLSANDEGNRGMRARASAFMDFQALGKDIVSRRLIVAKGVLFLLLGGLASGLLIVTTIVVPGLLAAWQAVALHVIAVWAFCRAYYFAFYVIEKYVDGKYRFAGLWSAARWVKMNWHPVPPNLSK